MVFLVNYNNININIKITLHYCNKFLLVNKKILILINSFYINTLFLRLFFVMLYNL